MVAFGVKSLFGNLREKQISSENIVLTKCLIGLRRFIEARRVLTHLLHLSPGSKIFGIVLPGGDENGAVDLLSI